MTITGKDLIDWGHEPGPWFKDAIASANKHAQQGHNMEAMPIMGLVFCRTVPVETTPAPSMAAAMSTRRQ